MKTLRKMAEYRQEKTREKMKMHIVSCDGVAAK